MSYQFKFPTEHGVTPGLRKIEDVSRDVLSAMVCGGYEMDRETINCAIDFSAAFLDEMEQRFGRFEEPTPDWQNQLERLKNV